MQTFETTELNAQELEMINGGGWIGAAIGAAVGSVGGPLGAVGGAIAGHFIEESIRSL